MLLAALLTGLAGCAPEPAPAPTALPSPATYAGSAACAECHAAAQAAWAGSHHAQAEAPLGDDERAALVSLPGVQVDGGAARVAVDPAVEPDGAGEITGRIGVAPLWQPLVSLSGGRVQALDRAWDPAAGEWFSPLAAAAPGAWTHWTGRALTWNSQCAPCHDTGVSAGYDADTDTWQTRVAETGVGCEACHGPSARHTAAPDAEPVPVPAPTLDTCAPCHSRRVALTAAAPPAGTAWLDGYVPLRVGDADTYWPDGQVRAEAFEAVSFAGSRMAEAGVRCVDCHEPHGGRVRATGDALCLGCHAARPGFVAHDHHAPRADGSASVTCVDCHMPTTVFMGRHPRHDHGFTVPDPGLGVEAGVPDACTRCHTDQPPAWAAGHVRAWFGEALRPSAARARALHRAEPAALAALAATEPHPIWRATVLRALGDHATDAEVAALLTRALGDTSPWVRLAAVEALGASPGREAVAAALGDPVRAVRVAAARALGRRLTPGTAGAADLEAWLAATADQPAGALAAGRWALERGDATGAWPSLGRAVTWDPDDAEAQLTYAFAGLRLGRRAEALAALEVATRLEPGLAEAWLALALARQEGGDRAGARAAIEAGLAARPDHAGLRRAAASFEP